MDDRNRFRRGGATAGRLYVEGNADTGWVSLHLHPHAVQRKTAEGTRVQQWASFEEMLVAEAHRLAAQFDELGRPRLIDK
jgi:hypothetical protein